MDATACDQCLAPLEDAATDEVITTLGVWCAACERGDSPEPVSGEALNPCAWCLAETGEAPNPDDSHGICPAHAEALCQQSDRRKAVGKLTP